MKRPIFTLEVEGPDEGTIARMDVIRDANGNLFLENVPISQLEARNLWATLDAGMGADPVPGPGEEFDPNERLKIREKIRALLNEAATMKRKK